MAREKKPVHKVQMTEGKRNIIYHLLEECDIQMTEDIQEALKDLLGGTIRRMMEKKSVQALDGVQAKLTENILIRLSATEICS